MVSAHRHIRWYWPDDEIWDWDELDADGWSLRHVETRGIDSAVLAAASLVEVIATRDAGGIDAVRADEDAYGVIPEDPVEPGSDADQQVVTVNWLESL
ncbi:hypothetical protein [Planosporangium mesophilum]|uniref:Uncharacterized protein n=1 Tax=Planosporangium mesophilum TaxID=689768 RepID=A0A8J3X790_9ACTN|nr:hypothetical protein [Planosporangium mesophilum]NJC86757.1 hypothetical protein [Planosporangium mesophilum]GII26448.1 hypothetical protein Pme01_60450 [Planosporangium mesophilum]